MEGIHTETLFRNIGQADFNSSSLDTSSLNPSAVMSVLTSIQSTMLMMRNEMVSNMSRIESKIQGIEDNQNDDEDKIIELNDKVDKQDAKISLLSNLVIKYEDQIKDLKKRVNEVEKQSMRINLVISGVREEHDENCGLQSANFFRRQLEINPVDIPISAAHRIGTGKQRQMVVKLKDPAKISSGILQYILA